MPRAPWSGSVRLARAEDGGTIAHLTAEREGVPVADVLRKIAEEFASVQTGAARQLFVAEQESVVVGFGRLGYEDAGGGRPQGWYLLGVVVAPTHRRRGAGFAITVARIEWVRERADAVYYFVNVKNAVSIALHEQLGFAEVTRDFEHEGARLKHGEGALYSLSLGTQYGGR